MSPEGPIDEPVVSLFTTSAVVFRSDLDVLERLLRKRRSIRRYPNEKVPFATILRLIEWQPWRFRLVEADEKGAPAQRMGEKLREGRLSDCDDPDAVFVYSRRWTGRVPSRSS